MKVRPDILINDLSDIREYFKVTTQIKNLICKSPTGSGPLEVDVLSDALSNPSPLTSASIASAIKFYECRPWRGLSMDDSSFLKSLFEPRDIGAAGDSESTFDLEAMIQGGDWSKEKAKRTTRITPFEFEKVFWEYEKAAYEGYIESYSLKLFVPQLIDELERTFQCAPGVIESLTWALNEVSDNVWEHGWEAVDHVYDDNRTIYALPHYCAMCSLQKESGVLNVCISDSGIGIRRSLMNCAVFKSSIDAIRHALGEGITSKPNRNQGNGLWGLRSIVATNSGNLKILSGDALYVLGQDGQERLESGLPVLDEMFEGTTVYFSMRLDREMSITKALGGHLPVNIRMENRENDSGYHTLSVKEFPAGTGTRNAGENFRNLVRNQFAQGAQVVIIDFSDVRIISSSFADEGIGKLVRDLGIINFHQQVRLLNMNDEVRGLISIATEKRLRQSGESS